jgi:hypothetical protein
MVRMDTSRTEIYWMPAVLIVLAIVGGVWWYTALDSSPLVPNSGGTASSSLEYVRE